MVKNVLAGKTYDPKQLKMLTGLTVVDTYIMRSVAWVVAARDVFCCFPIHKSNQMLAPARPRRELADLGWENMILGPKLPQLAQEEDLGWAAGSRITARTTLPRSSQIEVMLPRTSSKSKNKNKKNGCRKKFVMNHYGRVIAMERQPFIISSFPESSRRCTTESDPDKKLAHWNEGDWHYDGLLKTLHSGQLLNPGD